MQGVFILLSFYVLYDPWPSPKSDTALLGQTFGPYGCNNLLVSLNYQNAMT